MSAIMGWVARSRLRPRAAGASRQLRHPRSTLIIGLVGFVFFVALLVISNVYGNATTTWATTATFGGFALLTLPIIGDYLGARHEVSEHGLRYSRFISAGGFLPWTELKSVTFSQGMKWFRLEFRSGLVVRLSVVLMGLPEFARLLLAGTPNGVVERETRSILQATAEGNPPSVWAN